MKNINTQVCPVALSGSLDNSIRRWLQNPQKILRPYITEGMTVLDVGCGPGFFTIEMARMVGKSGRVIAADMQEGMLQKVKEKVKGTELEERILLHKCGEDKIGVSEPVDFVLLFYMVHEVPNKEHFFNEIGTILKPDGQILIVEPPFHVSKSAFEETVRIAANAGLIVIERPKMFFSRTVLLKKAWSQVDAFDANK
jgi:ubiquinone/menaquinone biosynthesis C-methylase UbiE